MGTARCRPDPAAMGEVQSGKGKDMQRDPRSDVGPGSDGAGSDSPAGGPSDADE